MNVEGQLVPASAIEAAAALAGSRSSSGLREMLMITMLAMMSSPAVASWTRVQRNRERERVRKRDFAEEEWKNGP